MTFGSLLEFGHAELESHESYDENKKLFGLTELTILLACKFDIYSISYRFVKHHIVDTNIIDWKIIYRSAKCHIVS
jgi:hypothetical protein